MISRNDIKISELKISEIDETSWLLANSMCTNPNLIAIFKSTEISARRKQRRMFEMVLRSEHTRTFTARRGDQILGSMSYTSCQHCQMSPFEILGQSPKLVRIFGKDLLPVLKWRMNWSKHDYKDEHVHFGPIAVHKDYQGKGVGKALLVNFCDHLDTTNQSGYLETDKAEDVSIYEKFGFEVRETDSLVGVTNWFMVRKKQRQVISNSK